MPYKTVQQAEKTNSGLKKYSDKAKRAWLHAFNSCFEKGDNKESTCFAYAYAAANNIDGKKKKSSAKKSSEKLLIAKELLKIAKAIIRNDE